MCFSLQTSQAHCIFWAANSIAYNGQWCISSKCGLMQSNNSLICLIFTQKPGPLFPGLPYSYYSSQHSAPGCCDSLPSLPGRYNPYTIPSATFPGTPRRPTPMSDLFSFNDIRTLQPPVPRTGVMDNVSMHNYTVIYVTPKAYLGRIKGIEVR